MTVENLMLYSFCQVKTAKLPQAIVLAFSYDNTGNCGSLISSDNVNKYRADKIKFTCQLRKLTCCEHGGSGLVSHLSQGKEKQVILLAIEDESGPVC